MPYRRNRRFRRRRSRYPSKTWVYANKGKRSQAKQIYKLTKAVRNHGRKLSDRAQYVQYKVTFGSNGITHGLDPLSSWQPAVKRLINPSGAWTPIFQTPTAAGNDNTNKFRGRSIGTEHMIQLEDPEGSEGDPVTCTLFCVTVRKEAARQFMNDTLNGSSLTQNQHYTLSSMGALQGSGMVMLNKGIFKIRYQKRFMLGAFTDFQADHPTSNLLDNNRRIYHRLSYPNVIKSNIGTKGYEQLDLVEIESTDQVFYYLFHNAYGSQAIAWHMNGVITGRETN